MWRPSHNRTPSNMKSWLPETFQRDFSKHTLENSICSPPLWISCLIWRLIQNSLQKVFFVNSRDILCFQKEMLENLSKSWSRSEIAIHCQNLGFNTLPCSITQLDESENDKVKISAGENDKVFLRIITTEQIATNYACPVGPYPRVGGLRDRTRCLSNSDSLSDTPLKTQRRNLEGKKELKILQNMLKCRKTK